MKKVCLSRWKSVFDYIYKMDPKGARIKQNWCWKMPSGDCWWWEIAKGQFNGANVKVQCQKSRMVRMDVEK